MSSGIVLSELQERRNKPSKINFVEQLFPHIWSHHLTEGEVRGQRSDLPRPWIEFIFSKLSSSFLYISPQEVSSGKNGFVGLFKQFGSISTPKSPSKSELFLEFPDDFYFLPVMKNKIFVSCLLLFSRAMWSESVFSAA